MRQVEFSAPSQPDIQMRLILENVDTLGVLSGTHIEPLQGIDIEKVMGRLTDATARSLLLLDEIGRGTSTFDGLSIAWATGRPAADRLTYLIEFPCRNLALALMVAVTGLGRPDFVPFAAVLLLTQALVMLSCAVFLRRERAPG